MWALRSEIEESMRPRPVSMRVQDGQVVRQESPPVSKTFNRQSKDKVMFLDRKKTTLKSRSVSAGDWHAPKDSQPVQSLSQTTIKTTPTILENREPPVEVTQIQEPVDSEQTKKVIQKQVYAPKHSQPPKEKPQRSRKNRAQSFEIKKTSEGIEVSFAKQREEAPPPPVDTRPHHYSSVMHKSWWENQVNQAIHVVKQEIDHSKYSSYATGNKSVAAPAVSYGNQAAQQMYQQQQQSPQHSPQWAYGHAVAQQQQQQAWAQMAAQQQWAQQQQPQVSPVAGGQGVQSVQALRVNKMQQELQQQQQFQAQRVQRQQQHQAAIDQQTAERHEVYPQIQAWQNAQEQMRLKRQQQQTQLKQLSKLQRQQLELQMQLQMKRDSQSSQQKQQSQQFQSQQCQSQQCQMQQMRQQTAQPVQLMQNDQGPMHQKTALQANFIPSRETFSAAQNNKGSQQQLQYHEQQRQNQISYQAQEKLLKVSSTGNKSQEQQNQKPPHGKEAIQNSREPHQINKKSLQPQQLANKLQSQQQQMRQHEQQHQQQQQKKQQLEQKQEVMSETLLASSASSIKSAKTEAPSQVILNFDKQPENLEYRTQNTVSLAENNEANTSNNMQPDQLPATEQEQQSLITSVVRAILPSTNAASPNKKDQQEMSARLRAEKERAEQAMHIRWAEEHNLIVKPEPTRAINAKEVVGKVKTSKINEMKKVLQEQSENMAELQMVQQSRRRSASPLKASQICQKLKSPKLNEVKQELQQLSFISSLNPKFAKLIGTAAIPAHPANALDDMTSPPAVEACSNIKDTTSPVKEELKEISFISSLSPQIKKFFGGNPSPPRPASVIGDMSSPQADEVNNSNNNNNNAPDHPAPQHSETDDLPQPSVVTSEAQTVFPTARAASLEDIQERNLFVAATQELISKPEPAPSMKANEVFEKIRSPKINVIKQGLQDQFYIGAMTVQQTKQEPATPMIASLLCEKIKSPVINEVKSELRDLGHIPTPKAHVATPTKPEPTPSRPTSVLGDMRSPIAHELKHIPTPKAAQAASAKPEQTRPRPASVLGDMRSPMVQELSHIPTPKAQLITPAKPEPTPPRPVTLLGDKRSPIAQEVKSELSELSAFPTPKAQMATPIKPKIISPSPATNIRSPITHEVNNDKTDHISTDNVPLQAAKAAFDQITSKITDVFCSMTNFPDVSEVKNTLDMQKTGEHVVNNEKKTAHGQKTDETEIKRPLSYHEKQRSIQVAFVEKLQKEKEDIKNKEQKSPLVTTQVKNTKETTADINEVKSPVRAVRKPYAEIQKDQLSYHEQQRARQQSYMESAKIKRQSIMEKTPSVKKTEAQTSIKSPLKSPQKKKQSSPSAARKGSTPVAAKNSSSSSPLKKALSLSVPKPQKTPSAMKQQKSPAASKPPPSPPQSPPLSENSKVGSWPWLVDKLLGSSVSDEMSSVQKKSEELLAKDGRLQNGLEKENKEPVENEENQQQITQAVMELPSMIKGLSPLGLVQLENKVKIPSVQNNQDEQLKKDDQQKNDQQIENKEKQMSPVVMELPSLIKGLSPLALTRLENKVEKQLEGQQQRLQKQQQELQQKQQQLQCQQQQCQQQHNYRFPQHLQTHGKKVNLLCEDKGEVLQSLSNHMQYQQQVLDLEQKKLEKHQQHIEYQQYTYRQQQLEKQQQQFETQQKQLEQQQEQFKKQQQQIEEQQKHLEKQQKQLEEHKEAYKHLSLEKQQQLFLATQKKLEDQQKELDAKLQKVEQHTQKIEHQQTFEERKMREQQQHEKEQFENYINSPIIQALTNQYQLKNQAENRQFQQPAKQPQPEEQQDKTFPVFMASPKTAARKIAQRHKASIGQDTTTSMIAQRHQANVHSATHRAKSFGSKGLPGKLTTKQQMDLWKKDLLQKQSQNLYQQQYAHHPNKNMFSDRGPCARAENIPEQPKSTDKQPGGAVTGAPVASNMGLVADGQKPFQVSLAGLMSAVGGMVERTDSNFSLMNDDHSMDSCSIVEELQKTSFAVKPRSPPAPARHNK